MVSILASAQLNSVDRSLLIQTNSAPSKSTNSNKKSGQSAKKNKSKKKKQVAKPIEVKPEVKAAEPEQEMQPVAKSFKQRFESMWMGGNPSEVENDQKQWEFSDSRWDLLSVDLALTNEALTASSNNQYRDSVSEIQGLQAAIGFYLTPYFIVNAKYMASSSGTRTTHFEKYGLNEQKFVTNLTWRRYLNMTFTSDYYEFFLEYEDHRLNPANGVGERLRLQNTGLTAGFGYMNAFTRHWRGYLSGRLAPSLTVAEGASYDQSVLSGNLKNCYDYGFEGRLIFLTDRRNQYYLFFDYRANSEKYDPSATLVENVSVNSKTETIGLGYRWAY